jgi:hypothetical protein
MERMKEMAPTAAVKCKIGGGQEAKTEILGKVVRALKRPHNRKEAEGR